MNREILLIRHLTDDVSIDLLYIRHNKEIVALKQKKKKKDFIMEKEFSMRIVSKPVTL